jgi:hypothetical protein
MTKPLEKMTEKERHLLKSFANLCMKIGWASSNLRRNGLYELADDLESALIELVDDFESALIAFAEIVENR